VSPGHTTEFDPGLLTRKSIDIVPVVRYDPWYLKRALDFLEENDGTYPYGDLIDAEFDLVEVDEALAKSDSREVTRATLLPH
jgi:threonine dehydrogenase-like Zn-dependent dehydrogenase